MRRSDEDYQSIAPWLPLVELDYQSGIMCSDCFVSSTTLINRVEQRYHGHASSKKENLSSRTPNKQPKPTRPWHSLSKPTTTNTLPTMAPTIHLLRHAQGHHNLPPGTGTYTLRDPSLTPHGEQQCRLLRETSFPAPSQSDISLVLASPLRRTLQTASLVFEPALSARGGKCAPRILALPDAQEISDDPCDAGSDPGVLRGIVEEEGWAVDLALVREGWNDKALEGRYSARSEAVGARARDARVFVRDRVRELVRGGDGEARVVLVAHGGWMHYFTGDWEGAWEGAGTGWLNCEVREFVFEGDLMGDEDCEARLVETGESRRRRGKVGPMAGEEKQAEFFELAMRSWGKQGLQRPDMVGVEASVCTTL